MVKLKFRCQFTNDSHLSNAIIIRMPLRILPSDSRLDLLVVKRVRVLMTLSGNKATQRKESVESVHYLSHPIGIIIIESRD